MHVLTGVVVAAAQPAAGHSKVNPAHSSSELHRAMAWAVVRFAVAPTSLPGSSAPTRWV